MTGRNAPPDPSFVPAIIILVGCIVIATIIMFFIPGDETATTIGSSVITVNVPNPPVPVAGENGINLAYELELSQFDQKTLSLERVEVIDPLTGKNIYTLESDLLQYLYHPASNPPPTTDELMNGTNKLIKPRVSLWIVLSPGSVPDRLIHRLRFNTTTIYSGEISVRKDRIPVTIGPPVRGGNWVAMETTSPSNHHFRSQITLGGITRVPQRYAQDWNGVDPVTWSIASGNVSLPMNFQGYGKEILSVANGTVIDVMDGVPDNELNFNVPPFNVSTLAGNYAIIDIGDGKYACYGHLIPGSLRVKAGDPVTEGQVIGLMGSSGNSDFPHLHFQVSDTPSLLSADGYPHVYRSFDVVARWNITAMVMQAATDTDFKATDIVGRFNTTVEVLPVPVKRENCLPENYAIVRFPVT